jgi:hypothetical protein
MRNISIGQIIILGIVLILLFKDYKKLSIYYIKFKKSITKIIRKKGI